ncbi:AraC family transcriptional regulator [Herminiimonas sp. KBW02]|uniref:helix-turn-helix transcriptional regulator n=1 Tax=Herminiimonas sp. KBW02 TaxID=2153363 RepID=UPI000F5B82EE|nr:AraC family transcriptional regulator [Herminiimonas sp. KBW02]RQO33506.1 AraC family transcriptional regulator [Herminiimonas sp. KBW02]
MIDEAKENGLSGGQIAWAAVAHVIANHASQDSAPETYDVHAPLSEAQMQRVHDYFQEHLQGGFRIAELAAAMGMSRTSFFKRFGRTAKATPNQYLQVLRVEKAKLLLRDQHFSLIDIAFSCGYADQSHLARFFKRYVRMSPGRYRSKMREEGG